MPTLYTPESGPTWKARSRREIDLARCRAQTYDSISRNFSQCARKKAVERDGIGYCKQHDPEAEKAREAERKRRYESESRARERQWKRPQDYRDALREIAEETKKQQLPITSRVHTIATEALAKWGDLAAD